MVRDAMMALGASISLFVGAAASAQTPTAGHPTRPDDIGEVLCAGEGLIGAEIDVGPPGPESIELGLDGGGTCGGFTSPSRLRASSPDSQARVVNCPAFEAQADKLRPSRQRRMRWQGAGSVPAVQVGPFTVTDWAGYFELQSPQGRRGAERWARQTLAAVRPCWDTSDDLDARHLVDRLYAKIGQRPG